METPEKKEVVRFLDYSRDHRVLVGDLIESVNKIIQDAFQNLTDGFAGLGSKSLASKKEAESKIEEAYTTEHEEHANFSAAQNSVDDLLKRMEDGRSISDVNIPQDGSLFSKGWEAVSFLDREISDILFILMGSLSFDDVIRQRLERLVNFIKLELRFLEEVKSEALDFENDKVLNLIDTYLGEMKKELRSLRAAGIYDIFLAQYEHSIKSDSSRKGFVHLSEFLALSSMLLSELTEEVAYLLTEAVTTATAGIYGLDSKTGKGKDHALSRMRQQKDGTFKNEVVNTDEGGEVQKFLHQLSEKIDGSIFEMVGVLSFGDVATQRLQTSSGLAKHLACLQLSSCKDSLALDEDVLNRRISICHKNSFSCFVTEEDKRIFKKVYSKGA